MTGDEDILKRVRAAIDAEPRIGIQFLQVGMRDGRLQLGGDVAHIAAKRLAVRLVQQVDEALPVDDRICVAPAQSRTDGEILDSFTQLILGQSEFSNCAIRRRLADRPTEVLRRNDTDNRSGDLTFSVNDGVLAFEGSVISLSHKRMAEVLAWWVAGCRNVINYLAIVPAEGDSDDEVSDAVRLALEMDPLVAHADQINLSTSQGIVTLQGAIASEEERHMAEFDTWCVLGVHGVENRLEVLR